MMCPPSEALTHSYPRTLVHSVTLNWTRAHVEHEHSRSRCTSSMVSSYVKCVQRATRRFNALFQKANRQLINIFELLLTDKQHREKPPADKKDIYPENNTQKTQQKEKKKSLTMACRTVWKWMMRGGRGEWCDAKRQGKIGPIEPLAIVAAEAVAAAVAKAAVAAATAAGEKRKNGKNGTSLNSM